MRVLEHLHMCGTCGDVFGWIDGLEAFPTPQDPADLDESEEPRDYIAEAFDALDNPPVVSFYQFCDCDGKPGMVDRSEAHTKFRDFDIREYAIVCYCCGRTKLRSGSRFATWFCERCNDWIKTFNQSRGLALIPTGRHSFMASISISGEEAQDDRKLNDFVEANKGLWERMELLEEWRKRRRLQDLDSFSWLGYDVPLDLYLRTAEVGTASHYDPMIPSPRARFEELSKYFLGFTTPKR